MAPSASIFVAGHRGLVGSALVRALQAHGYDHLVLAGREQLDLTDQRAVHAFFASERPQYVFVAAAKVGGILANDAYPADFIYDNLVMETNIIHAAATTGVGKLLFLGSTCAYPRLAPQPLKEEYLLSGPLEPTNEWYAVAKIAGIKLCQAFRRQHGYRFISAMPTNLYGPGDNFDPQSSHVLAALIGKFHEARIHHAPEVAIWGTGTPRREFLHVDDCASACLFLMNHYDDERPINVGVGSDISIMELAELVKRITGYEGRLVLDASRPDGTPRKLVDVSRLHALGWHHRIDLEDGIRQTYEWYVAHRRRAGAAPG